MNCDRKKFRWQNVCVDSWLQKRINWTFGAGWLNAVIGGNLHYYRGVDPPDHHAMLGMNNCETFWGGIPGQHCKSANWCHKLPLFISSLVKAQLIFFKPRVLFNIQRHLLFSSSMLKLRSESVIQLHFFRVLIISSPNSTSSLSDCQW